MGLLSLCFGYEFFQAGSSILDFLCLFLCLKHLPCSSSPAARHASNEIHMTRSKRICERRITTRLRIIPDESAGRNNRTWDYGLVFSLLSPRKKSMTFLRLEDLLETALRYLNNGIISVHLSAASSANYEVL